MTVPVLLVGDEKLRVVSPPVIDPSSSDFVLETKLLQQVLTEFREQNGFGR